MSDIVERLRDDESNEPYGERHQAADTITTLRAEVAALREGLEAAEQRGALAERERAAGIAENIGLSLDQIVEWADLSKLQFADKVAQHIAQVIRTGAKT